MRVLLQVSERRQALVMISLHELNLAALYTKDTLLLAHGMLIERGTTSDVITPANLERAFCALPLMVCHPHSDRMQHLPRAPD